LVWIRVPTVSASASTTIYFYYDELQDGSEYNSPSDVWADYAGVWHMNDATTSTILDSTSNNNDGTKKAANEPNEVDGQIGKAQDFDSTNSEYIVTTDIIDFSVGFSISALIKTSTVKSYKIIVANGPANGANGFMIDLSNGVARYFSSGGGGWLFSSSNLNDGFPHTIHLVHIGGTAKLYIDNVLEASELRTLPASNLNPIYIGSTTNPSVFFTEIIDEVQIRMIEDSSAWVGASYETQRDHFIYATSPVRCTVTDTDTLSGNGIAFLAFCAAIATLGVVLLMNKKMKRR